MKRLILLVTLLLPLLIAGQQTLLIDHTCLDPAQIPNEWIESAKENLWIGYGHTSHGGQLISGMDALEQYFTNGTYNWSQDGGPGELHLFEGDRYGTTHGYLVGDLGYDAWADETREYLDDFPGCNVIIWSWCGDVYFVDLQSHYLDPMNQLEMDYPNVQFVYMTGHLEGLGIGGSVQVANEQIRDYCTTNNKILFDFADIEKYSPESDTNFQEYYATDACDYNHPGGGTANWANDWLAANPGHELTQISELCASCSHSVSLNCTKKGNAAWFLWARLAGWEGPATIIEKKNPLVRNNSIKIYPNPARHEINIVFQESVYCNTVEICDINGRSIYSMLINEKRKILNVTNIEVPAGVYLVRIAGNNNIYNGRVSFY